MSKKKVNVDAENNIIDLDEKDVKVVEEDEQEEETVEEVDDTEEDESEEEEEEEDKKPTKKKTSKKKPKKQGLLQRIKKNGVPIVKTVATHALAGIGGAALFGTYLYFEAKKNSDPGRLTEAVIDTVKNCKPEDVVSEVEEALSSNMDVVGHF